MNKMNESLLELADLEDVSYYKRTICRFMAWRHGRPFQFGKSRLIVEGYPVDRAFTEEELLSVNFYTSISGCVSWYTIQSIPPKMIIQYMVQGKCFFAAKRGNPTRSKEVNKLLGLVKKMVIRSLGKESNDI